MTFPLTDPIALSRMWPSADIESAQILPKAWLIWLLSPLFLLAKLEPVRNYLKRKQANTKGALVEDAGGEMDVTVMAGYKEVTQSVTVRVDNMYDQTAKAGFASICKLLSKQYPPGVRSAGEIIQNPEESIRDMGAELLLK